MADSQPPEKKPESKLAQLRKAKGWSQQDLGVRAGIHAITVSEIERGATDPKQSTLERLAQALDVPVADLLNGEPKVVAG
jgi:transcriptional regulator with XRE-family HTH domain